jgi:glycogen(starch) synthase
MSGPRPRPPRRVLMLSWEFPPRLIGGIARHVDELSHALAAAGTEVDVLTAFHPGAPRTEILPAGEGRVKVLRAGESPVQPLDFPSEIHQLNFALLARLLEEGETKYDLLHAHDWLVAFAARTLKQGRQLPLVATVHATEEGRNGGLFSPLQHYIHSIEWLLTYDAWRVICCTEAMRAEVQRSLRTPPDKVRVVPNGIDPGRVRGRFPPAEVAAFRRRWAEPDDRIVMFVGRLVVEKGVDTLVEAMPEVLTEHPHAKLVVAGGGDHSSFAARATELGVRERVVFTGFLPEADLPKLYAVSDVAVFPSHYEPFGIVALEAMAAGVPVVTSDAGGFREVVRHLETGLHTWVGNPSSLAWGIKQVLGNAELASKLREHGPREVKARYGWDRIARQTQAVYEEVLTGKVAPVPAPEGPVLHPRYLTGESRPSRS